MSVQTVIKKIKQSFNKAAQSYDAAAHVQKEAAELLFERLAFFNIEPTCILDMGAGTGFITQQLADHFSGAHVIASDIAINMLNVIKQYQKANLSCSCADANKLPFADDSVDVIFSNLMLQWCDDLPTVFREWQRVLKPKGLLLFTSFGPDTLHELRASWASVNDKVHVNTFKDMHDLGDILLQQGFVDPVMDMELMQLAYDDVCALLKDLKAIGSINLNDTKHSLTGRGELAKLKSTYEKFRDDEHGLPATYEVIFGHAWGSETKREISGDIEIPIDMITKYQKIN